jgi:hypothetical protein
MNIDRPSPQPYLTTVWAEPSQPANENGGVAPAWQTPAEALQDIRRMKARWKQELAADFRRRSCPKHRETWEILVAMEKCIRWHVYGERSS